MCLRLYTDGACSYNGRENAVGGWAYVIIDENDSIIAKDHGHVKNTTNQQMELTALIKGLEAITKIDFFTCKCYSDSAYCINAINDGWIDKWRVNGWLTSKREPVKNQELWCALYSIYSNDRRFSFIKVKGHHTNEWNNYVDSMAVNAKNELYDF